MDKQVPSGMRSIAARNMTPISPLATPQPQQGGHVLAADLAQGRPSQRQEDQSPGGEPEPGRPGRADLSDQAHRPCRTQLHRQHRRHRQAPRRQPESAGHRGARHD
jgi:hypothetical protein